MTTKLMCFFPFLGKKKTNSAANLNVLNFSNTKTSLIISYKYELYLLSNCKPIESGGKDRRKLIIDYYNYYLFII